MITMKEFTKKIKGKRVQILYSNGNSDYIEVNDVIFGREDVSLHDGTFGYKLSLDAAADLYSKGSCMYKGNSFILKRRNSNGRNSIH